MKPLADAKKAVPLIELYPGQLHFNEAMEGQGSLIKARKVSSKGSSTSRLFPPAFIGEADMKSCACTTILRRYILRY